MNRICNLILEKRKEHGLTQAELGAMLGISGKAVTKWEHGLSQPCEEHLTQLVEPLGLRVEASTKTGDRHSHRRRHSYILSARSLFVFLLWWDTCGMCMQLGWDNINRFYRSFPWLLNGTFLF